MKNNRWTRRCTEWQPRRRKRPRGPPSRRWPRHSKEGGDHLEQEGNRQRTVEALMEGYILQWMDKAYVQGVKGERDKEVLQQQQKMPLIRDS